MYVLFQRLKDVSEELKKLQKQTGLEVTSVTSDLGSISSRTSASDSGDAQQIISTSIVSLFLYMIF